MKILFVSRGAPPKSDVDYQNDCLLIGLKELFGSDVIDCDKQSFIYTSYDAEAAKRLYGMGMTVSRALPDLEVDRTDIHAKIKSQYFDLIVYGSIWRCWTYVKETLEYYPRNKVIVVDGEDGSAIHPIYRYKLPYFKREHTLTAEDVIPISFAMPMSKINFNINKIKNFSYITPLDKSTYTHKDEESYYKDYNEARFGITAKKGGWDCMRHYEIMGNGCLPYFINIEQCPVNVMNQFPKQMCSDINRAVLEIGPESAYNRFIECMRLHFMTYNTTTALAKYFCDILAKDKL